MKSEFFVSGNYIYECKTSPSKIGEYFSNVYLKLSIDKLKARWDTGSLPSGYRYVFPVNYLDSGAVTLLQNLQREYPKVDIKYYDCDQVQKLITGLKKVGDMKSLVEYIEQIRK